ncbi:phosphatase PAP2 family protein [Rhizobium sp. CF122]|uniref:phosphatase PAP2 family protein n=1 Tax=Rhizobium sp. CF122 TaxID=1144312 RepID=UPI0002DEE67E|nr:phosphatase PAP2 family protein [Rhizobium sp. CF122]
MTADLWLYLAVAVYFVIGVVLLIADGHAEMMSFGLYFDQWTYLFLFLMPLMAIIFDYAWIFFRFDDRRSLAVRRAFSPQRLAHLFSGMALLMALMIFQGTFTSIKNLLPIIRGGFLYDQWLANLDALLSFGRDPWKLLLSIAGHDAIIKIVDWNYSVLWFVVCFGTLFYVATSPRAASMRVRYISMFMLVWVVCGNILAGIFISAGPVFYGAVTGDEWRFAELATFLALPDGPTAANLFQSYLWSLHAHSTSGFGSGISAFPSVHVGLIALNAFFAAEVSRRLGIIAFCYTAFVMASSVYLGWHYAVDGYASLLVVGVGHFALRSLLDRKPGLVATALHGAVATA